MTPIKQIQYPTNLLFFDTETKAHKLKRKPKSEFHKFWFGHVLAYRREANIRTRIIDQPIKSVDAFWKLIINRLDPKRPLWCFAHNIIFDLTILDCWQRADEYGIEIDMPVLDDPPVIICCSHERGKVNFIDTFNYWKCSVSDIGVSLGTPKLKLPKSPELSPKWLAYCRQDVHILGRAIDQLIRWLSDNDLGPLSYTIASIALNTYKHRFMPTNTIHIHDNDQLLSLERRAYHGGLTHSYFLGAVSGPIYKLDVNSLYPSVMLNNYPVQPISSPHVSTKRELLRAMHDHGAVAECVIDTNDHPYPVHDGHRLLEAVGHYRTVLCGQELYDALENDHVYSLGRVQLYELADIFSKYVNYFWTKRLEYKAANNGVGSMFCKYLLNSLYGKFGQRSTIWVDLNYDMLTSLYQQQGLEIPSDYDNENCLPDFSFGINHWQPLNYPEPLTLRFINGSLQIKQVQGDHHESSPIIAAYVTSYARSQMRGLRQISGEKNSFYTDTDSLFVNQRGFDNLQRKKQISSDRLGKLKLEEILTKLTIFGPKDYVTNNARVIKGIRKDAVPLCPACLEPLSKRQYCNTCKKPYINVTTFQQIQFEKVKSILRREPLPYIEIKQIVKTLSRKYNKGTVSPSGWTNYPRLGLTDTPDY